MLTKSEIQHVKSLRNKKFRQKYNQFVVEGEKAVTELLQTNTIIDNVYGTDEWVQHNLPLLKNINYTIVNTKALERISKGGTERQKILEGYAILRKNLKQEEPASIKVATAVIALAKK